MGDMLKYEDLETRLKSERLEATLTNVLGRIREERAWAEGIEAKKTWNVSRKSCSWRTIS